MSYDPITQDPPHDPDYPASMSELALYHGDALINGVIYHPVGEGAHPLILLLHGLPGHERNFDLAQILRRAGWAVCVFHYRGSWGSEGDYRFAHVLEDVQIVIKHFRDENTASQLRIDSENIITIGHSLGGWAALLAAAHGWVESAVSISGANIGLWGQQLHENPEFVRPMLTDLINSTLGPLHGASATDIIAEIEAHTEAWDLVQQAHKLSQKKLLLIGAKRDAVTPVFDHHMPVVDALKQADANQVTNKLIASDHAYSGTRIELARTILDWLKNTT